MQRSLFRDLDNEGAEISAAKMATLCNSTLHTFLGGRNDRVPLFRAAQMAECPKLSKYFRVCTVA